MDDDRNHTIDYDRIAEEYGRNRRVHPGVLQALIDGSGLSASSLVLEVGCGTGNYVVALQTGVGCPCWGVDPSDPMLAQARERSSQIVFCRGAAEHLDFPDASFDLVFSVDVIHHVGDRSAYFAEAARVLRPRGRVVTVTDSSEDIRRRRPLSNYFPETIAVELSRYPSIDVVQREMERVGFRDVDEQRVELAYDLADLRPYREQAFSTLHLIPADAYARGLGRLEADLRQGPIAALSLYTVIWGTALEASSRL